MIQKLKLFSNNTAMRRNESQNLKLGIFVLLGVVIFILAIFFIGSRQNLFGGNTTISSVFKDVNGLQAGNNVRVSGVNVGTVKNIEFINDSAISVDMLINDSTLRLINKNAVATISSDGLVGSMIVNIFPGDSRYAPAITSGDTIESISKIATADMLTTLNTTNENAAMLTADLLKITNSINKGEGVLGALLKDELMQKDLRKSIINLERSTTEVNKTLGTVNGVLGRIDYENSVAGILLSDSSAARNISNLIVNLKNSSEEISAVALDLRSFTESLESGEGALNYILNDTSFVNNIDATLQNAEEATSRFNENMEALKHNILFRGYFRRLERQKAREAGNN